MKTKLEKQMLKNKSKAQLTNINDNAIVDSNIQKMEQRLTKTTGENFKVVRDEKLASMSEALLEVAEPLMDNIEDGDRATYEKAIQMSIALWNVATMEESIIASRKNIFRRIFDAFKLRKLLKPFMRDKEIFDVARYLMNRKKQLYPNMNRYIIDYEITDKGKNYHLTVVSTVQQGALNATEQGVIGSSEKSMI